MNVFFSKKSHNLNIISLYLHRYYELLIHEDSDVALIRIFECFLESAPQKVLQITILLAGDVNVSSKSKSSISAAYCNILSLQFHRLFPFYLRY